jgi:hypothetical protein
VLALAISNSGAEGSGKIQDNSFLIEEAYNQEDGVVQHISAFQYSKKTRAWIFTFTQEWPVPKQKHQLSYTIPVMRTAGDPAETGFGDVALNYRYQLVMKDHLAVAPRFSVILPSGDYRKGLGKDAYGYQFNLPISVELSETWVTHLNAGATLTPGSREPGGAKADTMAYNAGASLIWLTSETFNVMLEAVVNSFESVMPDGSKQRGSTFFLNPGVRYAVNYPSGLQIVPGIAAPTGIGASHGDYGLFLYLSFEHPMF